MVEIRRGESCGLAGATSLAARLGAAMMTTKKDWVRLPGEWRERVSFLPVTLNLDYEDDLLDTIVAIILEKRA